MTTKVDQTSAFADHLQAMLDLVFEIKVDASEDIISCDLPGTASFDTQADGTIDVDLEGLGDVLKAYEVEVTPSTGTATITSDVSDNVLTLAIDSNQDLTAVDVDFVVRIALKRSL